MTRFVEAVTTSGAVPNLMTESNCFALSTKDSSNFFWSRTGVVAVTAGDTGRADAIELAAAATTVTGAAAGAGE